MKTIISQDKRIPWLLMLVLPGLCACAGLRKATPPYVTAWQAGIGGVYTETCRDGDAFWLAGHHRATLFKLKTDPGPMMIKSVRRVHAGHIRADGEGRCTQEGYQWPGDESIESQAASRVAQPLMGAPQVHMLGDKHQFEVSEGGWSYVVGGQLETGRRGMVGVRDAVLKEPFLWLLSAEGFWRLDLNQKRLLPIALPSNLIEARPAGFFQDGRAFWITTEDGRAWPVEIKGSYAHPIAKPGKFMPSPRRIRHPVHGGVIDWKGQGRLLEFLNEEGRTLLSRSSVDTILPIHSERVLVSSNGRIEVLHFDGDDVQVVQTVPIPGRTVRIFLRGQSLIAVGPEYGVLYGTLALPQSAPSGISP